MKQPHQTIRNHFKQFIKTKPIKKNHLSLLIDIDFPALRIWDILDVLVVAYLFYIIYQLLKGKIAFNIFIGVIAIVGIWKLTSLLNMKLTSTLFEQFASVGIIMLLIVFQPEIRRFLLVLGNTTLRQRYHFFDRWFSNNEKDNSSKRQLNIRSIKTAINNLSKEKTGALIVISNNLPLDTIGNTGVALDAEISHQLIESIFKKPSPLHDGAIIIANEKIKAASCVLPLSDNDDLPMDSGLRHRAAIGVTEQNDAVVFIISEENGTVSFSFNGQLKQNISENKISELLIEHL